MVLFTIKKWRQTLEYVVKSKIITKKKKFKGKIVCQPNNLKMLDII